MSDRSAVISPDGIYRYELRRIWGDPTRLVGWIMLNPSTADADLDDPTIRRCVGFAREWGYGGIVVRNLFALRATDPAALKVHPDPVGPENDEWLLAAGQDALTICAWGAHGSLRGRGTGVRDLLTAGGAQLHHLGLTKDGSPRHPLYLPRTATPVPWGTEQGGATLVAHDQRREDEDMSKSEAAKVAGRLQAKTAVQHIEMLVETMATATSELATATSELAAFAAKAVADPPLHELADADQVASELRAAEHRIEVLEQELNENGAHFDAAVQEYRAEIAELKTANEDLSDRLAKAESYGLGMSYEHGRAEDEAAGLRELLATAYIAREVPWADVAAGMMTIARDGTPWMVTDVDGLGTWVLQNGLKEYQKTPADGETVRVLEPYVTPEQATALVASELGGRA